MNSKQKGSSDKVITEIIYSLKLSTPLKEANRSLFAIISRNKWKNPENKIIYFVRLEFKLCRNENSNP
jgi:hypothetical protein